MARPLAPWLGWLGVAAAVGWVLLRTPAGLIPYVDAYVEFAKAWPASVLSVEQEYIRSSAVGQLVYGLIPWHSLAAFVTLHAVALGLALVALAWWLSRISTEGLRISRILVLGPIGAVLVAWVGSYDAFTVLLVVLLMIALTADRRIIAAVVGIVLGFQHFEQSVVILVSLALYAWLVRRDRLEWDPTLPGILLALGGVVVGKVALAAFLAQQGFSSAGGRLWWVQGDRLSVYLDQLQATWPVLLWSLFAGSWLVLIAWASRARPGRWTLLLCFVPALLASAIAEDHTRLFALTAWPLLMLLMLRLAAGESQAGEAVPGDAGAAAGGVRLRHVEYLSWIALPMIVWGSNVLVFGVPGPV